MFSIVKLIIELGTNTVIVFWVKVFLQYVICSLSLCVFTDANWKRIKYSTTSFTEPHSNIKLTDNLGHTTCHNVGQNQNEMTNQFSFNERLWNVSGKVYRCRIWIFSVFAYITISQSHTLVIVT